jgi:sugar lactone lactonase YvrE
MRLAAALILAAFLAAVPAAQGATDPCTKWSQKTLGNSLGSLENLEFDGRGNLLLSATGRGSIELMTPDGTVSTLIPNVRAPGGQRVVGNTLYFNTGDAAQSGLTSTPDGTIDRFDLDSHARTTFASGLTMPNGLAILPNGDLVVSRDIGTGTGITRVPAGDPAHPQANWSDLNDQNGLAVDPTGTWLYADQTFTLDSAVYRIRIANPADRSVVATLADSGPKGLDDLTIDRKGVLYIAANLTGEVIRLDPSTGKHCTIVTGLQNPSALKFGRGPGWDSNHLYATAFDGTVRELIPPAGVTPNGGGGGPATRPRLALSVRPRVASTDDRTRFRFTVYGIRAGKRTPLNGAQVKLAGKTARTNRRGRAAIALRFRRAGKRIASATKSGYKRATTTVRVHSEERD